MLLIHQPVTKFTHSPPVIKAGDVTLKAVDHFCYLGSILSIDVNADIDISARIAKASSSFGRLSKRLWNDHSIWLDTKCSSVQVSCSVLLFGCESWTLYRRHIKKLHQFHMRCLRQIAHVKWQDKIPNTEVLQRCQITGIEALKANLTMLDINPAHLESLTADRTSWRALCRQSIGSFEDSRVSHAKNKRRLRKQPRQHIHFFYSPV